MVARGRTTDVVKRDRGIPLSYSTGLTPCWGGVHFPFRPCLRVHMNWRVMIKIRYVDPNKISPGLHAAVECHGRSTTVYLLCGLRPQQRRAAFRRLKMSARMGYCPALPAPQLALARLADRIRTGLGQAGAVFRSHPAGSTVPLMVVSAGAIVFLLLPTVSSAPGTDRRRAIWRRPGGPRGRQASAAPLRAGSATRGAWSPGQPVPQRAAGAARTDPSGGPGFGHRTARTARPAAARPAGASWDSL
jgi:hypothetical protein